MEWLWQKAVEQLTVVKAAPFPFVVAVILFSALIGYGIFSYFNWIHREKVETQKQRISLLTDRLEEQRKATQDTVGTQQRLASNEAQREPSKIVTTPAEVMLQWSGGDGTRPCEAVINGKALSAFERDYNVALLCGISRADVDRVTDQHCS